MRASWGTDVCSTAQFYFSLHHQWAVGACTLRSRARTDCQAWTFIYLSIRCFSPPQTHLPHLPWRAVALIGAHQAAGVTYDTRKEQIKQRKATYWALYSGEPFPFPVANSVAEAERHKGGWASLVESFFLFWVLCPLWWTFPSQERRRLNVDHRGGSVSPSGPAT